jgi:hypothetical protein
MCQPSDDIHLSVSAFLLSHRHWRHLVLCNGTSSKAELCAECIIIITKCKGHRRSRYSDCLRAGRPRGRSSSPGRVKNFLFSTSSRPALGPTQPPIQWVPGALSPGVKRQGREADHSPPPSSEVKKMWMYTSTPPYAFTLPHYCCYLLTRVDTCVITFQTFIGKCLRLLYTFAKFMSFPPFFRIPLQSLSISSPIGTSLPLPS